MDYPEFRLKAEEETGKVQKVVLNINKRLRVTSTTSGFSAFFVLFWIFLDGGSGARDVAKEHLRAY